MNEMAAVRVRQVLAGYGDITVLEELTLELRSGVTALLGVNGAGKSSLLKCICGLLPPASGTVRIGAFDPYGSTRSQALSQIALVPQNAELPGHLRLADFLSYFAFLRAVRAKVRSAEVERVAAMVGLDGRLSSRMSQLSGGMQRRALIAQALIGEPKTLILDEPTTGLDPEQRATVRELIKTISGTRSVLLASHIVEDVAYVADRVVVLNEGRIVFDGTADSLQGQAAENGPSDGSAIENAFLRIIRGAS